MRVVYVLAMLIASTGVALAQVAPPVPLASPLPAATAPPSARGTFDRHQLTLAPGGSAVVHMFGASNMTLALSGPGVDARFEGPSRSVAVTALALGDVTITGTDPGGNTDTIAVHVVAPAGVVPSDVTVALAGAPAREFIIARVRAELRPLLHLCAACAFDLPGAANIDATQAAQRLDVRLRGANASTVNGSTTLHLAVVPYAPVREPVTLLYSDDPESVGADGVLFRSTQPIDAKHPARLYAYHAAADAGRNVYIVVTTTGAQSDVQLIGAGIGPYGDYHCVGHAATTAYLARRALHEGMLARVTPAAPLVLRVNARAMPAHTLVTGIYDVDVTGGDGVRITVVSASGDADPLALLNGKPEASDGHARRGEYDLTTVKPLTLNYIAGQPNESTLAAGGGGADGELMQLTADYPALHGEFGVLRTIDVHLQNAGAVAQTVNLYVTPVNGPDTVTMWFAGDFAPTEIGRVADPSSRTLVRQFTLAPGATQEASALFMADGSSWFPIEVGLTPAPVASAPANAFDVCARALTDQVSLFR
jgi:hypothetical protein